VTWLVISVLLLALSFWMLWKAVGEDPSEYERQRQEFVTAVRDLQREIDAVILPPLEKALRRFNKRDDDA
jgi:hypothetical protein